jgi:integrase
VAGIRFGNGRLVNPGDTYEVRREHRKPLPMAAVSLLKELQELTGDGRFAFPAIHDRKRTMSENTLNQALRRMGFKADEATAHGFRASASSLLNESGQWSPDAIEAELAHIDTNSIRKAYHRAQYWDERVKMAERWASSILKWRPAKLRPA